MLRDNLIVVNKLLQRGTVLGTKWLLELARKSITKKKKKKSLKIKNRREIKIRSKFQTVSNEPS